MTRFQLTDFKQRNHEFLLELSRKAQSQPNTRKVMSEVVNRLQDSPFRDAVFDNEKELTPSAVASIYRYGMPCFELCEGQSLSDRARLISFQLHCIILWRVLDDLIDRDIGIAAGADQFSRTLINCVDYSVSILDIPRNLCSEAILDAISTIIQASQKNDVSWHSIRKRASLHLLPMKMLGASRESLEAFEIYCTIFGVLHDVADVFGDVRSGIVTAPIDWLVKTSTLSTFSKSSSESFFVYFEKCIEDMLSDLASKHRLSRGSFIMDNIDFGHSLVFGRTLFD